MPMLARLKPYNPKAGQVRRSYTIRGIKIEEGKGWYEVPDSIAEYLRGVHAEELRPGEDENHTPLCFDIKTEAEAKALAASEFRRKVEGAEATPDNPHRSARNRVRKTSEFMANAAGEVVGSEPAPPLPTKRVDVSGGGKRSRS